MEKQLLPRVSEKIYEEEGKDLFSREKGEYTAELLERSIDRPLPELKERYLRDGLIEALEADVTFKMLERIKDNNPQILRLFSEYTFGHRNSSPQNEEIEEQIL